MAIYKTPYDTTACRGYKTIVEKVQTAIQTLVIQGNHLFVDKEDKVIYVRGGPNVDPLVPAFAHPVAITLPKISWDPAGDYVAQDVRPLVKFNPMDESVYIRNQSEYNAAIVRSKLMTLWITGGVDMVKSASDLPLMVYTNWVAEAVAKRMSLDPRDQLSLGILAGVFYLCLFKDDIDGDDPSWKSYLSSKIARALNYRGDAVHAVVQEYSSINSVSELCEAAKQFTQSVRLSDLNAATLFAIVGGYWYGHNGREIICTALEHPPSFMALLFQGLNDRGFRNTNLTKILDRPSYKKHAGQYNLQVVGLLESRG